MIIFGGTQKAGSSWIFRTLASAPSLTRGSKKEWHYWRGVGIARDSRLAELPPLDAAALRQRKLLRLQRRPQRPRGWWGGKPSVRGAQHVEHENALDQWVALCRSVDIADFTPANILLSEAQWSEISAALPEARIIVSVRNPVQRAWSQIRKDRRKKQESSWDGESIIRAALSPSVRGRSCVAATVRLLIARWPGQVFVTSLDDISEDPASVMNGLARFVGVGDEALTNPGVVNSGVPREMPRAARAFLEREWASEHAALEDIAGRALLR